MCCSFQSLCSTPWAPFWATLNFCFFVALSTKGNYALKPKANSLNYRRGCYTSLGPFSPWSSFWWWGSPRWSFAQAELKWIKLLSHLFMSLGSKCSALILASQMCSIQIGLFFRLPRWRPFFLNLVDFFPLVILQVALL